jgi:hypothetical protein
MKSDPIVLTDDLGVLILNHVGDSKTDKNKIGAEQYLIVQ